jgi:DNA-binding GntR family transcriptional regulator
MADVTQLWPSVSSAAAGVAAELRRAVTRGELSPGDQIRQAEWAQRLRVSRVPVREALESLRSEGILSHDHNRGYFVARFGPSEASQIYLMRRFLETEILKNADWPMAQQISRLRAIGQQASDALLARDIDTWTELDRRFVKQLYQLCPLELLRMEAERLWTLSNVYRRLTVLAPEENIRRAALFYAELIDALEVHDRPKMIRLISANRRRAESFYVDVLVHRTWPTRTSDLVASSV